MIGEQKVFEIAQKLLEESRVDKVVWNEDHLAGRTRYYFVQFPESRLGIRFDSPSTQPDNIYVWIENNDKKTIADLRVNEDERDDRWISIRDLYNEADRYVMGWDKTLTEIEKELEKEGRIGLMSER